MDDGIFSSADILLFNGEEKEKFAVVACDQYTSEPEYWEQVKAYVGESPSALNMIFPEAEFKTADFDKKIAQINKTMNEYITSNLFGEYNDAVIYTKRKLRNGKTRYGVIGKIDLEKYDYNKGSQSAVRATEGTVLERIPPRVKIRENAPLEMPHVMILIDDREKKIIENLRAHRDDFEKLYEVNLMQDSGVIKGYLVDEENKAELFAALAELADEAVYHEKYGVSAKNPLVYAVGDGNHSLATAKKCYQNLKEQIGEEAAKNSPARYALCEIVNLHDNSLEFEAIHRICTGVKAEDLLKKLNSALKTSTEPVSGAQMIEAVVSGERIPLYIGAPTHTLAVGTLQEFLDSYMGENGGETDYIHGEDVVCELSQNQNSIGFILPAMDKNDLFKTVIKDGALPRKTFSMGEACDKRFYYEARKIK